MAGVGEKMCRVPSASLLRCDLALSLSGITPGLHKHSVSSVHYRKTGKINTSAILTACK